MCEHFGFIIALFCHEIFFAVTYEQAKEESCLAKISYRKRH